MYSLLRVEEVVVGTSFCFRSLCRRGGGVRAGRVVGGVAVPWIVGNVCPYRSVMKGSNTSFQKRQQEDMSVSLSVAKGLPYLNQKDAQELDNKLMTKLNYSLGQLMELAGLSVAQAVAHAYPVSQFPKILVVCGPGNNGGDGLVCARHLYHFGYQIHVVYPKATQNQLYKDLLSQCSHLKIPISSSLPYKDLSEFKLIVDGIFGFSFTGDIRPPFDEIIQSIKDSAIPVASIDIPSGWDITNGNVSGKGLEPDFLISLTAPKEAAKHFKGKYHYLGGRFVPPEIEEQYGLQSLSKLYQKYDQFALL